MHTQLSNKRYLLLLTILVFCFPQAEATYKCVKKDVKTTMPDGVLSSTQQSNRLLDISFLQHTLTKKIKNRFHCFSVPLGYSPPSWGYEVAASVLSIEAYDDPNGIDFSIRVAPKPSTFEGIFTVSAEAFWVSAKFSFIVTSRQDIRAGIFVADTAPFLTCSTTDTKTVVHTHLHNPWKSSKKFIIVMPFLSGMKTQDPDFRLRFGLTDFQVENSRISIQLRLSYNSNPLQLLYVSYIVYTLDSEFQIYQITNFNPTELSKDKQIFIGIDGKNTQLLASQQDEDTQSSPDPKLPSIPNPSRPAGLLRSTLKKYQDFEKAFKVKGITLEASTFMDINWRRVAPMPNKLVPKQQNNECISKQECTTLGGYYYVDSRTNTSLDQISLPSFTCQFCDTDQQFSEAHSSCVCRAGYSKDPSGRCVKDIVGGLIIDMPISKDPTCKEKGIMILGVCYEMELSPSLPEVKRCNKNEVLKNNVCQCVTGYLRDVNSHDCFLDPCQSKTGEFVYRNGRCECLDATKHNINGRCEECKYLQIWDENRKECNCGTNSMRLYNSCFKCSNNANWSRGICQCKPGFVGNGIICR